MIQFQFSLNSLKIKGPKNCYKLKGFQCQLKPHLTQSTEIRYLLYPLSFTH